MPLHVHQDHVTPNERKRKATRALGFRGFWRSFSPIADRRAKRIPLQPISNVSHPPLRNTGSLLPHTDVDYPPKPTKRSKRQVATPPGPRPLTALANVHAPIPFHCAERDAVYYDRRSRRSQYVFLVENVLFKTDTSLLMRDESAFSNMFGLPMNEDDSPDGTSDQHPIVLHDTANQFRALLWVLNALPLELQLHDVNSLPPIGRLLDLAEITHKYHFQLYESWALSAIHNVITHRHTACSIFPSLFSRIISVSVLSDRPETFEFVIAYLHSRIIRDRRFVIPPSLLSVSRAHGIKKPIVAILYRQLVNEDRRGRRRETQPRQDDPPSSPSTEPDDQLQTAIRNSARASLQTLWKTLSDTPPSFEPGCHDASGSISQVLEDGSQPCACQTEWRRIWFQACSAAPVERCDAVDVVGRLRRIIRVLEGGEGVVTTRMCVSCALSALEKVEETLEDVIEHMDIHFP